MRGLPTHQTVSLAASPRRVVHHIGLPSHHEALMLSDYPHFDSLTLPDQLRLTALEAEDRLPLRMLDAIQRAADLLGPVGTPLGVYIPCRRV